MIEVSRDSGIHSVVGDGGQIVGHAQVFEVLVRIDLDGVISAREAARIAASRPPLGPSIVFSSVSGWFPYRRTLQRRIGGREPDELYCASIKFADAASENYKLFPLGVSANLA